MAEQDRMLVVQTSDQFLWMNIEKWFWSCNLFIIDAFSLSLCYLIFSYIVVVNWFFHIRRFFSVLDIVMSLLCFSFWLGCTKIVAICFSDSFFQQTVEQPNGSCNLRIDSRCFSKLLKKQSFFCDRTWKMHCELKTMYYDDKICFLPNRRCDNLLVGDIKLMLKEIDAFCFNSQHLDTL